MRASGGTFCRCARGARRARVKPYGITARNRKVAKITRDQVRTIAEAKMPDLNANDIEGAEKIIAGTARSMGITIKD